MTTELTPTEIRVFIREQCPTVSPAGINYYPLVFGDYDIESVGVCRRWIDKFAHKTARIRYSPTSYYLKHVVERWSDRYISNGSFIIAAAISGYRWIPHNHVNAVFNLACVRGRC